MSTGLARLIRHKRPALSDAEFEAIWRAFDPAAQRTLEKLGRGRGITTSEARHLADALRRQGIGQPGRSNVESGAVVDDARRREAAASWQAAYRRLGRARDDAPAEDGEGSDGGDAGHQRQGNQHQGNQRQDNRPTRGRHLESWRNAYRAIGRLKPEEDH